MTLNLGLASGFTALKSEYTMKNLPFLTVYDPIGTSEGSLDPLGLYLIADQLAMKLVPGVRERMLRAGNYRND